MKKKGLRRAPVLTVLLFVLAAALLSVGTIGGIRAARRVESPYYVAGLELSDIGVTLLENGEAVAWRDYAEAADGTWNERRGALLGELLGSDDEVKLGKRYEETLCVRNSGHIDTYVRVVLRRWWEDEHGNRLQTLSPELIGLELGGDGWIVDEAASTPERTVLYYRLALAPGETTPDFCAGLRLDPALRNALETQRVLLTNGTLVTEHYPYEGVAFRVEAEVDAVQTHNAENAIRSAWGRSVSVSGGVLSLGEEAGQ